MRHWRNKPHCSINQKLSIPPIHRKTFSQVVALPLQRYSWKTRSKRVSPLIGYGKRYLTSLQQQQADPTIYALSTPPGRSAIAIIRISGPACLHVRSQVHICQRSQKKQKGNSVPFYRSIGDSALEDNSQSLDMLHFERFTNPKAYRWRTGKSLTLTL